MATNGLLFNGPRNKPTSTSGNFMPACYRVFYFSQSTLLAPIYGDAGLTAALSNPVFAASDGRFPLIYLDPSITYRVQLFDAVGNQLEDTDPYTLPPSLNVVKAGVEADFANPAAGFGADLVSNGVRSYDIVVDVRAAPPPSVSTGETLVIAVQGKTVVGDAGGGLFYWSSTDGASDDTGITTITPNALVAIPGSVGRYKRLYSSSVGTFSANVNGGTAGTVSFTRTGNIVTLQTQGSIVGARGGSPGLVVTLSPIPTNVSPLVGVVVSVPCYNLLDGAGNVRAGFASIGTGSISFFLSTVTGTNITGGGSGNSGFTSATNTGVGPGWCVTFPMQ